MGHMSDSVGAISLLLKHHNSNSFKILIFSTFPDTDDMMREAEAGADADDAGM